MSNNMKLIDAIMNGDSAAAREEFTAAINDKVNTVLDIRRVTMASDVFNQVQEAASMKKEILNPNVVKDLPENIHADDMMYNDCEEDDEVEEASGNSESAKIAQLRSHTRPEDLKTGSKWKIGKVSHKETIKDITIKSVEKSGFMTKVTYHDDTNDKDGSLMFDGFRKLLIKKI